jgi:hypothetical protein
MGWGLNGMELVYDIAKCRNSSGQYAYFVYERCDIEWLIIEFLNDTQYGSGFHANSFHISNFS